MLYSTHENSTGVYDRIHRVLAAVASHVALLLHVRNAGRRTACWLSFFLVLFFVPLTASAAVAFDKAADGDDGAGASPAYYTITPTTGGETGCFTQVTDFSNTDTVTNVQVGTGAGTTSATKEGFAYGNSDRGIDKWCITNLGSGTLTVEVTWPGGSYMTSFYSLYSGVGAVDAVATSSVSGLSLALTTTPTLLNAWLESGTVQQNRIPTAGSGTTVRASGAATGAIGDNNAAINPIAATTMNWSVSSGSGGFNGVIVALEPTTATIKTYPTEICLGGYCFFQ